MLVEMWKINTWKQWLADLLGYNYKPLCKGVAGVVEREVFIFYHLNGCFPSTAVVPKEVKQALEAQMQPYKMKTIVGVRIEYSDVNMIELR